MIPSEHLEASNFDLGAKVFEASPVCFAFLGFGTCLGPFFAFAFPFDLGVAFVLGIVFAFLGRG
jgi:hypothetical protein